MEVHLDATSLITMFMAMLALAAVPDASAFAVVARALASGISHAFITVLGIVTGDLVFILIAFYGLSAVAENYYGVFTFIKLVACGYLIWLAYQLWQAKPGNTNITGVSEPSWLSNFSCGLLITLSDPKAILFYISFLPAFVDLRQATILDASIILLLATTSIASIKLAYALMANKSRILFNNHTNVQNINRIAAIAMFATAIFLLTKL